MEKWTVEETNGELRLAPLRGLGSDRFTWAHLLYGRLDLVQVYIVYFPSRFDLTADKTVIDTLRTFGTNTGPSTSVNVWDTRDPNFGTALDLFDIKSPPALVLATDYSSKRSTLSAQIKPTSTPLRLHVWMFSAAPTNCPGQ